MDRTQAVFAPSDPPAGGRRWLVLAVLLIATFMSVLNSTIVNIAIPAIRHDLGATSGQSEWIIGAYALGYGVFLIPGGRLGDSWGRRKVFLIGVAGFTAASLLCGVAGGVEAVIGGTALQGVCAGLMIPQVIAAIPAIFAPAERGKAFGFYGVATGLGAAVGPLAGGALISANPLELSWRTVFLVGVPVGFASFLTGLWLLPESRGEAGRVDLLGMVLLAATLLLLLVPLTTTHQTGWPLWSIFCMAAAAPALALLAVHQRLRKGHGRTPLIDLGLFGVRSFVAGVVVALCYFATFQGLLFTLSVFLQEGLKRSPLAAGLVLAPFAIGAIVSSSNSDRVARRLGKWVVTLGSAIAFLGLSATLWTVHVEGAPSALMLAPGLLVVGLGHGLIIAPNISLGLRDVSPRVAGAAGGAISTAQRIGQTLGVALLGEVFFDYLSSGYAPAMQAALVGDLVGITLVFVAVFLVPSRSRPSK